MKNVIKRLGKSVLILSELTEAASATELSIQESIYGSGTRLLNFLMNKWKIL